MKNGDRVYHRAMREHGTIDLIDGHGTVYVTYDKETLPSPRAAGLVHWKGEYDQRWFELHPELLVASVGQPSAAEDDERRGWTKDQHGNLTRIAGG